MGKITARIIYQDGNINVTGATCTFDCMANGAHAGYIYPVAGCDGTEWDEVHEAKLSPTVGASDKAMYGVWVMVDGRYVLVDIQSSNTETPSTTMTLPILTAKLNEMVTACACVDCSSATPVTVVTNVYTTYSTPAAALCYTVTRADGSTTAAVSQFNVDYMAYLSGNGATITAVGANSVYKFSSYVAPIAQKSGDTIAVVSC